MADEPELRPALVDRLRRARDVVAAEDPYHPCIMLNDTIAGTRAEGSILLSLLYARVRVRLMPDDDQYSDEELFEASLLSILPDNRLLITGTRVSELDPIPAQEVQICEDADWPTLSAIHCPAP